MSPSSALGGGARRARAVHAGRAYRAAAGLLDPRLAADPTGQSGGESRRARRVFSPERRSPSIGTARTVTCRQTSGVYAYTREALEAGFGSRRYRERWERAGAAAALLHAIPIGVALCEAPRRRSGYGGRPAGVRGRSWRDNWGGESVSSTKYILVSGGVVSSLGKGMGRGRGACCGARLKVRSRSSTLHQRGSRHRSPFQHGEVYVTDDGAETRPRPRPLRALHRPLPLQVNNVTRRIYLSVHHQGAPRRYSATVAGDPPHTDEIRPRSAVSAPTNDVVITEIAHGGRHRVAAVPRGDPPVRQEVGRDQHAVHPPHPRPLHRAHRRAQDQPTQLRARADGNRDFSQISSCAGPNDRSPRTQAQDRPVLQRGLRLRGGRAPTFARSTRSPLKLHDPGARQGSVPPPGIDTKEPDLRAWAAMVERPARQRTDQDRVVASTRSSPTATRASRGAGPTAASQRRRGGRGLDRLRRFTDQEKAASCSPLPWAPRARRLRVRGVDGMVEPSAGRASTSCRSSASAAGCRRRSSSSDGRSATSPSMRAIQRDQPVLQRLDSLRVGGCCRPSVRTR